MMASGHQRASSHWRAHRRCANLPNPGATYLARSPRRLVDREPTGARPVRCSRTVRVSVDDLGPGPASIPVRTATRPARAPPQRLVAHERRGRLARAAAGRVPIDASHDLGPSRSAPSSHRPAPLCSPRERLADRAARPGVAVVAPSSMRAQVARPGSRSCGTADRARRRARRRRPQARLSASSTTRRPRSAVRRPTVTRATTRRRWR